MGHRITKKPLTLAKRQETKANVLNEQTKITANIRDEKRKPDFSSFFSLLSSCQKNMG